VTDLVTVYNPESISFAWSFVRIGLLTDCSLKVLFSLLSVFIESLSARRAMAVEQRIGFVTNDRMVARMPADPCSVLHSFACRNTATQ
jgi:hypothetical protein